MSNRKPSFRQDEHPLGMWMKEWLEVTEEEQRFYRASEPGTRERGRYVNGVIKTSGHSPGGDRTGFGGFKSFHK